MTKKKKHEENKVFDTHRWVFVSISSDDESFKDIPLLCPKSNVAKQFNVEIWLDAKPILEAVGLKPRKEESPDKKLRRYVV